MFNAVFPPWYCMNQCYNVSMTPEEIAALEGIKIKTLYNALSAMRDCPKKQWKGWRFKKNGKCWEGKRVHGAKKDD